MKYLLKSFTAAIRRMRSHKTAVLGLLGGALLCAVLCSLTLGSSGLRLEEVLGALTGRAGGAAKNIVLYVRLPRTLGAVLAGSALAVAGVMIQGVLANPLAGPNIIGVNAGAGFAAMLCSALFPASFSAIPFAAFLGALGASLLVFGIARKTGASRITLVLAGVAVSSMLSAGIDALSTLYPDAALGANTFMVGGLAGVTLRSLAVPGIYIGVAVLAALALSYELDLLSLGDDIALSLGLRAGMYRFLLLVVSAALAGAAVSFAGLVGFVGLIVPHAARFLVGSENRVLVPACALLGALLVTVCDLLARLLFAPFELPVGIVLSLLGGPFFLWLLMRHRGGRTHD